MYRKQDDMKATKRNNGTMMITMKIEAHISFFDIVASILDLMDDVNSAEINPTKKQVLDNLKAVIRSTGQESLGANPQNLYINDYNEDELNEIATQIADKLFPEMNKGEVE